jgi:hypothetical protein
VVVDIGDFVEPLLANESQHYDAVFKLHFDYDRCRLPTRIRPIAPLGVVTWNQFDEVRKLRYEPTDKVVCSVSGSRHRLL